MRIVNEMALVKRKEVRAGDLRCLDQEKSHLMKIRKRLSWRRDHCDRYKEVNKEIKTRVMAVTKKFGEDRLNELFYTDLARWHKEIGNATELRY